ncbi:PAS domain S-box protein [Microcoleus sp. FACHB-1515]|uniref:PAS domain S-box protein n=1 Tax=Cyanophyceae TaxID=3028117 RepID=UPI001687BAE7|nr:PAS domain S-box protein [Microcoleus sp. FACHB-1515]MBD2088844.1 PAS domain S-box protein [Microcoleus sp. FACHB-1515]
MANLYKSIAKRVNLVASLLLFVLPFTIVVYQLIVEIDADKDFVRREMQGSQYLRPLHSLLVALPQRSRLADAEINQHFDRLASVEQQFGNTLDTAELYGRLQADWQARQSSNRLVADLRALISRVGDRSKLILDPDLDSYYLMDAVLLKLPAIQDLFSQVQQLGLDILSRRGVSAGDRSILIELSGLIESNWQQLAQGMEVAFTNNPSRQLQPILTPSIEQAMTGTQSLVESLNRLLNAERIDRQTFEQSVQAAIDTSSELWEQTIHELDQLLIARLGKFDRKTDWVEAFALLVLATVFYVFVAFSRNLAQRRRVERRLNAQYATTRVLAESATIDHAMPSLLSAICTSLQWEMGELWTIDFAAKSLSLRATWHATPQTRPLEAASRHISFTIGNGLPGKVWQTGEAFWIEDIATHGEFQRRSLAVDLDLHSACGFPIRSGDQVVGVLSFFSRSRQRFDAELLEMMTAIGQQVGQFIDRHQAEEALRQSEALQRIALNAAGMGAWDWNIQTGEETWSKEVERIFGLTAGAFSGVYEHFFEFVHPDDRARVKQAQVDTLHEGRDYSPEYRIVRPDGSLRWVSARGNVTCGENGEPLRLSGVTMDITDRKQMELALTESEHRLRQQSAALANLAQHKSFAEGDLEQAFRAITEAAAAPLQVARVCIWLFNRDRTLWECIDLFDRNQDVHLCIEPLRVADYPAYFGALTTNRAIAAHDLKSDPALSAFWTTYFQPNGITATLDAPIVISGQVVGVVCHEHIGEAREWTLDEQGFAGSIADFVVLALEVSERKRTEDALRAAEEKYRSIFENAVTGIFQTTPDGRYLSANPALARIYSYASPQALIEQLTQIDRQLYVDPARRQQFIDRMQTQGRVVDFESQVYRQDGSVIWISENAIAVHDETGALLYYEGTVENITDRKRTEEALNRQLTAIEASIDGISILDVQGCFIYMNQAHASIYGYDRPEMLIGQSWKVLYDEIERSRFQQEVIPAVMQIGQWRGEAIGVRRDGSTYPQEVSLVAIEDGSLVCVVQDITERKSVEAALRQSKETAEQANQAKSQFLANMSHELRTPLNAIIGYSEMLREDLIAAGQAEFVLDLSKIHQAGTHLLALISDILDLSKIDAGKMPIDTQPIDVAALVTEITQSMHSILTANQNQFAIDCPRSIGLIESDPDKIKQILCNLLANAAKFTHNGTITLRVSLKEVGDQEFEVSKSPAATQPTSPQPPTALICFQVSDTGIGIAPDQQERIFRVFTQGDESSTRQYGGTGLGLALGRRLSELLGGSLSVESGLDRGSTFTLLLPAVQPSCYPSAARPASC